MTFCRGCGLHTSMMLRLSTMKSVKTPITESDMFRIASEDSMFNIMNIQDQMDYNTNRYLANGSGII